MKYILILIIALSISSCATRQQKAIKHLNKALSLDSTVLKHIIVPITIDTTIINNGVIVIDTIIKTPETKTGEKITPEKFESLVDSLKILNKEVTLLETEQLKLTLQRTKDGLIDVKGLLKPQYIPYKDTIPYIDTIPFHLQTKAPSVAPITKIVTKKGYFYNVGVALHYILGIAGVLAVLYYVFYRRNSRNKGS